MKGITLGLPIRLKTKAIYNVYFNGKDTGFVAKEVFTKGTTRWYPFFIKGEKAFPKYSKLKYISTSNRRIPSTGFSINPTKGFGFTKSQGVNAFFKRLEKEVFNIKAIKFAKKSEIIKSGTVNISFKDFDKIRARAKSFSSTKHSEEVNLISFTLNEIFPILNLKISDKLVYFEGGLTRYLEKFAPETFKLSQEDIDSLKKTLNSQIELEQIISTKKEINKIYIEEVLGKFEILMKLKSDTKSIEDKWHQFFRQHTWIFSQIFAFPAIFFDDKVSVGGEDFSGGTDKIIDFLYKNKITNNVAFIEIKTHKTKLINSSPYRKPDIYSLSKDLSGAIVQVLDQKTKFLKNYYVKKGTTNIDSLNSTCLILIGNIASVKSKSMIDSFELFRAGNKDVIIVTFDELHEKIKTLLEIFTK